jgi:cytochrome c556
MTRLSQFAASMAVAVVMALPVVAQASDPTDVIDYRKHIMKTLAAETASLNMILQGKIPVDNFALHAETLAHTAATALIAFEPEVEGGEAKPEVWTNYADFTKKMNDFAAGTAALAKAARSGGVEAAKPLVQTALTCKGCHDTYREKK